MITIMRTILKVVLGSSSQILSMIEDKLIMKEEEEIGVTIAFYKFWEL